MKQTVLSMSFWLIFGLLLAACTGSDLTVPEATVVPEESVAMENMLVPTETPEPTPVPERSLVVCLGKEPETLFLYGGASDSMWSVLESIYDGPFDQVGYQEQPVILTALPSVENGGVVFQPVVVAAGDIVVDAQGKLSKLEEGLAILPAGCTNPNCAIPWQVDQGIEMDQMVVQFQLLAGLLWSDGAPLTADDSVFSYQVANDPALPVSQYRMDRTQNYEAISETEVIWSGIAGFFPRSVADLFWIPLPQHQLSDYAPGDLPGLSIAAETPLGWGPYVIEDWVAGDHITLAKNENYFRFDEGLPVFDRLVYRFSGNSPQDFLKALQVGECDAVDRTANLSEIVHDVRVAELNGEVNLYLNQGLEWSQLMIGIQPASYDDGYNVYQEDRPDYFSEPKMRQALSACLNREEILSQFYFNMVDIPDSYVLPTHPAYFSEGTRQGYDPELGKTLLNELGWKDFGGGVRVASGVSGVIDGTPLAINLALLETVTSLRNQNVIEYFAEDLQVCGFETAPILASPMDLYEPGPEGRVFGRNFDLVEITWAAGSEPACILYMSDQIPSESNYWVGVNAGGYSNPEYDAACHVAMNTRLDDEATYLAAQFEAQRIFLEDLPAIPLYFQLEAAASRIDLCAFSPDVSARSDFWNLESLDFSENCIE